MKYYKLDHTIEDLAFATKDSACFDLRAYISQDKNIVGYNVRNDESSFRPGPKQTLCIRPAYRVLIPTALIFDIPFGYSVRLHSRSGLALRSGLMLSNGEGVIDSDYVEEVKVILYNSSHADVYIQHGDRICQAELVQKLDYEMIEIKEPPAIKTDRAGGFGSTGE